MFVAPFRGTVLSVRVLDDTAPFGETAKALGAYYTDAQVADFLTGWAIRGPHDRVIDPSFGGGVFLRSACKRLQALGGIPGDQVYGVEIDAATYHRITEKLSGEFHLRASNTFRVDFFWFEAGALEVDAVVGNPPFIRYQRFSGDARKRALECAAAQGVRLSELASSWAPFLVHATAMLRPGGRLAMVVPAEVSHATYARQLLAYLCRAFRDVLFLTFEKKLFPELSEDTFLVLADGRGMGPARLRRLDLRDAGELARITGDHSLPSTEAVDLDISGVTSGKERLTASFVPGDALSLYRELAVADRVSRLGQLADVGIGYVTGANDYFHLSPDEVRFRGIPCEYLTPAVRRGRSLAGLRYTQADWIGGTAAGESGYLLRIQDPEGLPESVHEYLAEGVTQGVHQAYKCRKRSPWFRVPHVHRPDALLTYMSGARPRLVANEAEVVAPNSLHVVRLHHGSPATARALGVLWESGLTRLSSEIEGHSLGGGMLKVEPTEAERILIPVPNSQLGHLDELAVELDQRMRAGNEAEVGDVVDRIVLQDGIGLTKAECGLLRSAAATLKARRYRLAEAD